MRSNTFIHPNIYVDACVCVCVCVSFTSANNNARVAALLFIEIHWVFVRFFTNNKIEYYFCSLTLIKISCFFDVPGMYF